VRHGAGRGRLRLHRDGWVLLCQVSDDGPPRAGNGQEPAPGAPPSWPAEHAHGLWMIGQVADEFTLDHGPAGTTGTTATASFTISPDPEAP
jgi:serine/threonine-protein kinase RsbW